LQRYVRNALRYDNALYRDLYDGLWRPGHRTTPDTTKDPNTQLPKSYESMIQKAESEMPFEELERRYAPPSGKPYTKSHLQY